MGGRKEHHLSVITTFVVEVLDLRPQRIARVISFKTQHAHDGDDDDGDHDDSYTGQIHDER